MTTLAPPLLVTALHAGDLVRAGLQVVLAGHADRVRLVDSARVAAADVVLIDSVGMLTCLGKVPSTARTVVLSTERTHALVAVALAAGATGYLSMALSPEAIVDALVAVAEGDTIVALGPGQDRRDQARQDGQVDPPGDLSRRELEVLTLVGSGYSNVEIGGRLYLSENTVKTYVRTAYRKIGATRRAHAVRWAFDHGLRLRAPHEREQRTRV